MKIITDRQLTDAAMELVTEKGYSETTTREIAERAGVNEVTLFRRFGGKKEIILKALEGDRWIPRLDVDFFALATGDLETDLRHFMLEYCKRVTPQVVKVSIGLRSPQIYEQTKRHIRRIPESFIAALQKYFETMQEKGAIISGDPHTLAVTVFSAAFGFVFLQASFGNELSPISQEEYIKSSVKMFVKGLGNGTPFPQA